jgi:hypothetical protein
MDARYAVAVAVMLACAAVPTALHGYLGLRQDDGLTTSVIPAVLDGAPSQVFQRRAGWADANLQSTDYTERTYRVAGRDVRLLVARSHDAKRLYHHPELAALRGFETAGAGVARAAARPDVPLHVLTTAQGGQRGVAVYALLYDGRYVENPILFQLRTSVELLFSGRKPMTLIMATDLAGSVDDLEKAPATRILLAALGAFEAQTPGQESASK